MTTRARNDKAPLKRTEERVFRMAPIARAIALTLAAGAVTMPAHAQRAFSPAWFANKGAIQNTAAQTGRLPNGMPASSLTNPLGQQQKANEQLQRSISNLNLAARGIAAQQAAQAAARLAAANDPSVPDGLAEGGLKVDTNSLTAGWINANAPTQTIADGRTNVTIGQTADKAILNWETFNVGRNTTVNFDQATYDAAGNRTAQTNWAVLNKVNDPNARPSQIQGQIKADGTVMIVNRNGVVFSGTSQVNTRNLVAAAATISTDQFENRGLYNGTAPSFTDAAGQIIVEAGAVIDTARPASSTTGGGYILLLGKEVSNAGTLSANKGQVALAAGDSFVITKGAGTDGNLTSTTRGNEVVASGSGTILNTGLIQAPTGDITLTASDVRQQGVAVATTSVDVRGTVHLNATGATGKVTLGQDSVTSILLESTDATALDSQRDGLQKPAVDTTENNIVPGDTYRRDQSLVEIRSGGTVDFEAGSLTLATGGQIAVEAAQRALVRDGAVLDVSGAIGVQVAMEANNLKINIQGNEQRDAPGNRDSKNLNSNDVWIDRRSLVFVPAGTNGYATDRWYTAGGLLEVGGYLGTQGHGVGEWMAQGGTVSFTGNDVVTQQGSQINLSGGTLDVATGKIRQSWLKVSDGRLYEVSKAPGDLIYTGLYKGFEDSSERWNVADYYYNPLIAPQSRLENGYTVGRDAGTLVIGTKSAVLEGQIVGDTFQGDRQTQAAQQELDGYHQSQKAVARGGQLVVGSYIPYYVKDRGTLRHRLTADANTVQDVILGTTAEQIAAGLDLSTALPQEHQGTLFLDTERLNGFGLGSVKIAARNSITVENDLAVGHAGEITLYGPQVDVNADLTSHGGAIVLGNVLNQISANARIEDTTLAAPAGTAAAVTVAEGVTLNASGLWSNLLLLPSHMQDLPHLNGGRVSLRSVGDVTLGEGSVIDVSSGAALLSNGKLRGGKGGDVSLRASSFMRDGALPLEGTLTLDGTLRGTGVSGGGTLSLQAVGMQIGGALTLDSNAVGTLHLDAGFFDKGFARYDLNANQHLAVAEGAMVDVRMPVLELTADARQVVGGAAPSDALAQILPALYEAAPTTGVMGQRRGASLQLRVGAKESSAASVIDALLSIGKGAVVTVDPGQSIALASIGQLSVDGRLNAWGGDIALRQVALGETQDENTRTPGHNRSIRIGQHALLDASARAMTALDVRGARYGLVGDGGRIVVGGEIDAATGYTSGSDQFVVIERGARLEASGAQAVLDLSGAPGLTVAGDGGHIGIASLSGLYLEGDLVAHAGGAGAAGGTLNIGLDGNIYPTRLIVPERVRAQREMIIAQQRLADGAPGTLAGLADGELVYGNARVSIDAITAGGFDAVSLLAPTLSFDESLTLATGRSLALYADNIGLANGADPASRVSVTAPHLLLAGYMRPGRDFYVGAHAPQSHVSIRETQAVFTAEAGFIDVRDEIGFGGGMAANESTDTHGVDRRGFERVVLHSTGDIRLRATSNPIGSGNTAVSTAAAMEVRATQIYPDTGAKAVLRAGRIDVARASETDPALPYAVFGSLTLESNVINQGGVLRAPLGSIMLTSPTYFGGQIDLLAGSLTSVSAAGLTMPYGGTVDGVAYTYDGASIDKLFMDQAALGLITLKGESVQVQSGAVVDISGGGDITGAGFVSGRGGSTDARFHPLLQVSAEGGFTLPGLATNPVYAIVPGVQVVQAPVVGGASASAVGRQITVPAGVAGLPAGTYTLMPSTYALLPGAFRVEINGDVVGDPTAQAVAMRNGSFSTGAHLSTAGTSVRDTLARQVILTPAPVLRTYSQYNEMSLSAFALADAARLAVPAVLQVGDGKKLNLNLNGPAFGATDLERPFSFDGLLRSDGAQGGARGTSRVDKANSVEIVADGAARTPGFVGTTLRDADLNAIAAGGLSIGGGASAVYGQGGNILTFNSSASSVHLRTGASLVAPAVFLVAKGGSISVEEGASIITLGQGAATQDSAIGYVFAPIATGVLAVSNGRLDVLANDAFNPNSPNETPASIHIGVCGEVCTGATQLYSEGAIAMATYNAFEMTDAVRYGTRNLALAVGGINVGRDETLDAMAADGKLPAGLTLNQDLLDRLLRGDTALGAPAMETLSLAAGEGMRFYGDVVLDTYDVDGVSRLQDLVLTTPALYGAGDAGNTVTLRTASLIWNGSPTAPGAVVKGGAGDGAGVLNIEAERITLGYADHAQVKPLNAHDRLVLGFDTVNLDASERISANHKGSLAVHQRQGVYMAGKGYTYSGGDLNLRTPLLSAQAGAVTQISAGGTLLASSPTPADPRTLADLGASAMGGELSLSARDLVVDTTVLLPSGKLSLLAERDLTLTGASHLDLAGRALEFNDVNRYSWGGDVKLASLHGHITQAAGAVIDLSAVNNQAGTLEAVALDAAAGTVDLQGRILGSSSGRHDAGGTMVPFKAGSVDIRAQNLGVALDGAFAALNQRLNEGGVFGARSFQFKQGDLVIGNELKAGEVNVSIDNGHLTVAGTIDASGERVGSIRLAGQHGLTIGGNAVLDAHGTVLRVDSYGKIIDSPNRAVVDLNSGNGLLTLINGARIDLRHGTSATTGTHAGQHDGQKRGTLELNAPRTGETSGDIQIDASGFLTIEGARSIAVNAVWRYDDSDPLAIVKDGSDAVNGRPYREVTQAYLDHKHAQSTTFMDAALANGALLHGKLAGLNNAAYADALHLRPGIEIVTDTDLVVQGDLDLSGFRYASLNARMQQTGVYGSGEAGRLVLRAAGDMDVYGSINDGFAPPPATQDDSGWLLVEGVQPFGGDVRVPGSNVVLHDGTAFERGKVLNYDLPIQAMTMAGGTLLPVTATLSGEARLAAGTVLSGDILHADGSLMHAAGTILAQDQVLPPNTRLGAGTRLAANTELAGMTWPAGVPLPSAPKASGVFVPVVRLAGSLSLKAGSLIPSMTDVKLGGAESIALRPADADGQQGRNWALAQMLPEGSSSWSLQLVAGADLGAADSRLTSPQAAHGSLRLADTHYGMNAVAAGGLVWTEAGAADMGGVAGEPIDFENGPAAGWPTMCDEYPEFCTVSSGIVWTELGANDMGAPELAGQPIDFENGPATGWPTMCDEYPEFCAVSSGNVAYERGGSRTSVVRTGTGDLTLAAARDVRTDSLYGVYTAGTATAVDSSYLQPRGRNTNGNVLAEKVGGYEALVNGDTSLYQAWYPDRGGNLYLSAGGQLMGDLVSQYNSGNTDNDMTQASSSAVGNWLWRQGSGDALLAAHSVPTAWWINFGTYATVDPRASTALVGFTGFGTLGGGNLDVRVGHDAGAIEHRGDTSTTSGAQRHPRSQALVLAIGSTGRVGADGSLQLTGGGDLSMRVGGGINPTLAARNMLDDNGRVSAPVHDLQGTIVNLRGATWVQAGAVGGIDLQFSRFANQNDASEARAFDVYQATKGGATGGITLIPGDSAMSLNTRGDLVMGSVADAGRVPQRNTQAFTLANGTQYLSGGSSWFSLWTPHTAIDLFSAGGNLTPGTQSAETENNNSAAILAGRDASPTDGRYVYPSILRLTAAQGSIYYGASALGSEAGLRSLIQYGIVLAPSPLGELAFLAGDSMYGGGYAISASSASPSVLATPLQPGFVGREDGYIERVSNQGDARLKGGVSSRFPLFAFGADTAAGNSSGTPAHFYALSGDIVGLRNGEQLTLNPSLEKWYVGAGAVRVIAGRDIVASGTGPGDPTTSASELSSSSSGNLFVHDALTDVSIVSAGRDILYSSFNVAGPGTLEISAGRDIRMEDRASVASIGAVALNDTRPGSDIVMLAGVGRAGPDYQGFLRRYLDSTNLLPAGMALADRPGSAVKVYGGAEDLLPWLQQTQAYSGTTADALAFFQALAPEQQRIYARHVYYAELREGGREYNDVDGVRFGSYLRGRHAIAALFPGSTADGQARNYEGDITMYGPSGVNTLFGGDIQLFTPGGAQVFGTEGEAPVAKGNVTPGVITQGVGDIALYSLGSILLGQSRIMTTFGGGILGWSAEGDINAGRGSKTTIVYTPPKRVYDQWGNVTLSSDVPSTGAGIATLAPIPEVPAGDIDLIAPLGTIDAGEAGIRVSGNVNLAALQVVNAANIQVQGEATGIPTVAAVNVGALTNASAAASQASVAAQDVMQRERASARQNLPSIFTVRVLGFGNEALEGGTQTSPPKAPGTGLQSDAERYDPSKMVKVVGLAERIDPKYWARMTEAERQSLRQDR